MPKATKDPVDLPGESQTVEVKPSKSVVLFSIFPEYEIGLEQPHESKHLQNGIIERMKHNGSKIVFKNHKAKVSAEVYEKLSGTKDPETGQYLEGKEPERKLNVTYWDVEDLKKKLFDPRHRRWARKFRDDVERRNGMHESINDAYFMTILDNPNAKIGGVEVARA